MNTKKFYKVIAAFLAISLLTQVIYPTAAWALTGGPSQPEVESFEPVGTTEMVDLFSGDFNYNIPLMTVPGPNGGYPINLAYHAGIGLEQEASWVGLGWNINPGVINRSMRGLPDDFHGDAVTTTRSMKPNNTFAYTLTRRTGETAGFHLGSEIRQIYLNSYKGVGQRVSLSFVPEGKSNWAFALSLSYGSDDGLGVEPSLSYTRTGDVYRHKTQLGFGMSSREGLYKVSLKYDLDKKHLYTVDNGSGIKTSTGWDNMNHGAGISFSGSSFVPNVDMKMHGTNVRVSFTSGQENAFVFTPATRTTGFLLSTEFADRDPQVHDAYGYLYTQKASSLALKDLNREKDVPPTKDIPTMPIPIYSYDIFQVNGQGIGGMMRPFRSDVGLLADANIENTFTGGNIGFELGAGASAGYKFGGEIGINTSTSFSGKWRNPDHYNEISDLNSQDYSNSDPLYEPAYFKSTGEITASSSTELDHLLGESPARFNIKLGLSGISLKPELTDELTTNYNNSSSTTTIDASDAKRSSRERRAQYMSTRTNEEIYKAAGYISRPAHIYPVNQFPGSVTGTAYEYKRDSDPGFSKSKAAKHIGEVEVYNPDGNRYVYGIPVYNIAQKEVAFSIDGDKNSVSDPFAYPKVRPYSHTGNHPDNSVKNNQGSDHYFSSTELPPYVHSHLLTAIYSPDYVDLTGNGPTEDDFGYYVKFNYSKATSDYKWRVPFKDGNSAPGDFSNENDDKLTYTYGEKEIYYLNSIETKTHIAKFYLQTTDRRDAFGAADENNAGNTFSSLNPQKALEKISLYSKRAPNQAIKSVHFTYTYDLCKSVANNKYQDNNGTYAESGKLTLSQVHFTYLGSNKGELSPYRFYYYEDENNPQTYENPDYGLTQVDRWGNYRPDATAPANSRNEDNPYVNQSEFNEVNINREAGAWNLKKIKLPSGGEIKVTYEADDYAYVQDKVAMQMAVIKGTADNDQGSNIHGELEDEDQYVYFELEKQVSPSATAQEKAAIMDSYLSGVSKLYFKTFQKLKRFPGTGVTQFAYDYVEGYADVEAYGMGPIGLSGNYETGWVKLALQPKKENGPNVVHPFRLAGWQYLKMKRPDLLNQPNDLGGAVYELVPYTQLFQLLKEAIKMVGGFYNYCFINGFCREIQYQPTATPYKPSFIRVNTPDRKKWGGGHRVHSITLDDKWDTMASGETSSTYGQEYSYEMPDGSSSGVAEYEPLIGGEEIPHRLPVRYSSNKFLVNDNALYIEGPYGEQFYPGAGIGYSRVTIKSVGPKNADGDPIATKTASGITVHEFYTAKDFPVKVDYTDLQHKKYRVPVIIPFFGVESFNNHGYSQGYRIELNNMHGQVKAMSVYPAGTDLSLPGLQPTSRTEYIYQTKYTPGSNPNYLDNEVDVLYADGQYGKAQLGRTYEFYVDLRENWHTTTDFGLEPNIDGQAMLMIGNAIPYLNYSEAMFRSVVTNKVIHKNGILEEIRNYTDGAMVATKNLIFDAETGQPLLTQVTNDFEAPVYTYNYAAHWSYDNMGGAYKNGQMMFELSSGNTPAGYFNYPGADSYFTPGDEIVHIKRTSSDEVTGVDKYWVQSIDAVSDNVYFIEEDGSTTGVISVGTNDRFKIQRSGRRNQQSVTNGTIVSLSNPLLNRKFPVFTDPSNPAYGLNAFLNTTNTIDATAINDFSYNDCATGETVSVDAHVGNVFNGIGLTGNCRADIVFPSSFIVTDLNQVRNFTFVKLGNAVKITDNNGNVMYGEWKDYGNCFSECLDDVLHAEAYRFEDGWTYNYADVGDPSVQYTSSATQIALSTVVAGTHNPYRIGTKGIWHAESNYLYQVKRKQESPHTKISKDGTYENFVLYSWQSTNNEKWSKVSQVTQYSPYGFELENKDALGIYSSALYGYDNSLATAVAANTSYMELAYDGFEDYNTATSYPVSGGHGHLQFTAPGSAVPSLVSNAHTGSKGLQVLSDSPAEYSCTTVSKPVIELPGFTSYTHFAPVAGKEYIVSTWVKVPSGVTASMVVTVGSNSPVTYSNSAQAITIDGWQLLEARFTAPATGQGVTIRLESNGSLSSPVVFDDIRMHPFKGAVKTYVYDPATLWLLAELDNRNFATFYNYDEEGALVQVKKETEKGVVTIKSSRNNIKPQ